MREIERRREGVGKRMKEVERGEEREKREEKREIAMSKIDGLRERENKRESGKCRRRAVKREDGKEREE